MSAQSAAPSLVVLESVLTPMHEADAVHFFSHSYRDVTVEVGSTAEAV
jgi:hypothetical protein